MNKSWSSRKILKNMFFCLLKLLKAWQNKNNLNDVTAATFLVSFFQLPETKKNTEKWADVTSLRSFLFCQGFNKHFSKKFSEKYFLAHHFSKLLGNYIICLHCLFIYFSILLHFLKKKIVCCLLTIMNIHKKSRRHII